MGSVVVWTLLRIVRPLPVHGPFDGAARTLFAAWQACAPAHGATRLLRLFLVVEVAVGVVQLVPWWRSRRPQPLAATLRPSGSSRLAHIRSAPGSSALPSTTRKGSEGRERSSPTCGE
ncbi:hypothetical protein [Streptosporangium sp. OZ121]|uniref:hypothetical protein n=1 Tax=Streptosporangium sp. OZ121 TaxID=3444183 RepID=UPI003F78B56A